MIKIDCVRVDIDSKLRSSCTWIDTGLRNPYGVGYFLHVQFQESFQVLRYCAFETQIVTIEITDIKMLILNKDDLKFLTQFTYLIYLIRFSTHIFNEEGRRGGVGG